MSIPIILHLPPSGALAEASAFSFSQGLRSGIDRLPSLDLALPEFRLDTAYAALPLARGRDRLEHGFAATLGASGPGGQGYIVRGEVEDAQALAALNTRTQQRYQRQAVFSDPKIEPFTCMTTPPIGTTATVQTCLDSTRLNALGMTGAGTAIAILDTGINLPHLVTQGIAASSLDPSLTWAVPGGPAPGTAPVNHGTMCAYDALIAAPAATLLDFPILSNVTSVAALLSNAVAAYTYINLNYFALPAHQRPFGRLILSNSWGLYDPASDFPPGTPGRYIDNPRHTFNQLVGTLAAAGADIVFAAGNCGPACAYPQCNNSPAIMGANGHPDVLCVGGIDTTGNVVGYSSHGPALLTRQKPDLAAYTHFTGSKVNLVFGDQGTSAACPVMAGVLAALRSAAAGSTNPRTLLIQHLLRNARRNGPAGHQFSDGFGTVDLHFVTSLQFAQSIV